MAGVSPEQAPIDYSAAINSYGLGQANIANTNQNTALQSQQTQGAALDNQQKAVQLQLLQRGVSQLSDTSGQDRARAQADDQSGADPSGAEATDSGDMSAFAGDASLDVGLRHAFWVNPMGTQDEQNAIISANLSGNRGLADAMTARRDMAVGQRTAIAQRESSDLFDKFHAVQAAPDGSAMFVLEGLGLSKQSLAIIKQQIAAAENDGDSEDEAVRDTAAHIMASVHQFTGRPIFAGTDGVYRDEKTGQVIPDTVAGLNAQQTAQLRTDLSKLVDVKMSDGSTEQQPTWRANHLGRNLGEAVQNVASHYVARTQFQAEVQNGAQTVAVRGAAYGRPGQPGQPGAAPGAAPGGPAPGAPGAQPGVPGAQPGQPGAGLGAPAQPSPAGAAPGVGPSAQPQPPPIPTQERTALSDPTYKLSNTLPPVVSGRTPTTDEASQRTDAAKARSDLYQESQTATSGAAAALVYVNAARAIMASGGKVPTGLAAPIQVAISKAVQAVGLSPGEWATKYQELAKYLGNAALQNARTTFGSKMTQREVQLQLDELSPSAKMTPNAINQMLNTVGNVSQYQIASAQRARRYLATGGDARVFAQYNQQYFPMSDAVNQGAGSPAPQLPDPSLNKGRVILNKSTNQRLISDGHAWVPATQTPAMAPPRGP